MASVEARLLKLEQAAGAGDKYRDMSDEELDLAIERFIPGYSAMDDIEQGIVLREARRQLLEDLYR
jgi:hypothetical protein